MPKSYDDMTRKEKAAEMAKLGYPQEEEEDELSANDAVKAKQAKDNAIAAGFGGLFGGKRRRKRKTKRI